MRFSSPAWVRTTALGALAAALVLGVHSAYGAASTSVSLPAAPSIVRADGSIVAAVVPGDRKGRCAEIVLWRIGHDPVAIKTFVECSNDGVGLDRVVELAFRGQTVAWQETNGGNNLELSISKATLARPKERGISYVENGGGAAGDPAGPHTGSLVGHGGLMAYASWTECDRAGGGYARACAAGRPDIYGQRLHRIGGRVLLWGADALHPVWTDGSAILVHHADGTLALVGADGRVLRRFPAVPGLVGAVFQGSQLVTLTGTAITVWNDRTGAKVRTFALVPGKRVLEDLDGGVAVLGSRGTTHLIRLSDGRGATFTRAAHAQLERQGLYFAAGSALRFVPRAELTRRFG